MIILLIKLIALTTVSCLMVKTLLHEGMALEKLGKYAAKKVEDGYKIFDPLLHCEWCLPSIHSIFGFALAFGLGVMPFEWDNKLPLLYFVTAIPTSFVSGTLWNLAMALLDYRALLEVKTKHYKHIERLSYWDVQDRKQKHHENKSR